MDSRSRHFKEYNGLNDDDKNDDDKNDDDKNDDDEKSFLLVSQTGSFVEDIETPQSCCSSVRKSITSCCKCFFPHPSSAYATTIFSLASNK